MIFWLINEYNEEATFFNQVYGETRVPITLHQLLDSTCKVESEKICSAWYLPKEVEFDYFCTLWIENNITRVHVKASQCGFWTDTEITLHGVGIRVKYNPNNLEHHDLEHQQAVIQWLIKKYSKDTTSYYTNWIIKEL